MPSGLSGYMSRIIGRHARDGTIIVYSYRQKPNRAARAAHVLYGGAPEDRERPCDRNSILAFNADPAAKYWSARALDDISCESYVDTYRATRAKPTT